MVAGDLTASIANVDFYNAKEIAERVNGNHGVITGATYETGIVGNYALNFNSTGQKVTIPHNSVFLLTSGFTISTWINSNSYGESNLGYIIGMDDADNSINGFAFRWAGVSGDMIGLRVNSGTPCLSGNGDILPDGNWYHALVTCDSNGDAQIYINGTASGSSLNIGNPANITSKENLIIGNSKVGDRNFDGLIDEVLVYNRVLNSGEIATLYNKQKVQTGLIVKYSFEEGSGTAALDTSKIEFTSPSSSTLTTLTSQTDKLLFIPSKSQGLFLRVEREA